MPIMVSRNSSWHWVIGVVTYVIFLNIMNFQSLKQAYKGKKVLITGHTGFKGSWLAIWLHELGAGLTGIALEPKTKKDNYVLSGIGDKMNEYLTDIRDLNSIKEIIDKEQPEILFHLAAQPLVFDSYK